MSTAATTPASHVTARDRAPSGILPSLAGQEIRRYLRHPLFWVGVALTALPSLSTDPLTSSLFHVIAPAAGLGLFGLVVMSSSPAAPTGPQPPREASVCRSALGPCPWRERGRGSPDRCARVVRLGCVGLSDHGRPCVRAALRERRGPSGRTQSSSTSVWSLLSVARSWAWSLRAGCTFEGQQPSPWSSSSW